MHCLQITKLYHREKPGQHRPKNQIPEHIAFLQKLLQAVSQGGGTPRSEDIKSYLTNSQLYTTESKTVRSPSEMLHEPCTDST